LQRDNEVKPRLAYSKVCFREIAMILTCCLIVGLSGFNYACEQPDEYCLFVSSNTDVPLLVLFMPVYALISAGIVALLLSVPFILRIIANTKVHAGAVQSIAINVIDLYYWVVNTQNIPMQHQHGLFAINTDRSDCVDGVTVLHRHPLQAVYSLKINGINQRVFALGKGDGSCGKLVHADSLLTIGRAAGVGSPRGFVLSKLYHRFMAIASHKTPFIQGKAPWCGGALPAFFNNPAAFRQGIGVCLNHTL
jgi:hypothetical protein